jgi:hypothetical protein
MGSRTSPILCGDLDVEYGELSDATTKWIAPSSLDTVRRQMLNERLQLAAESRKEDPRKATLQTELDAFDTKYGRVTFDSATKKVKGLTESAELEDWMIDSDRISFFNQLSLQLSENPNAHPAKIVALGRTSDATDARDKIFAFSGFMNPEFLARITAGYDSPVEEVFTDFSVAWIEESQSVDILTYCLLEHELRPTWVPDWSKKDWSPLLPIGQRENPYNAGGDIGIHQFSQDKKFLSVAGIIFDTIDGLSATEDEAVNRVVQPTSKENPFGSLHNYRDVLWRTFLGNRDHEFNTPSPSGIDDDFRPLIDVPLPEYGGHLPAPWNKSFYSFVETNKDFMINGRRLETYFVNEGRREPLMPDASSVRIMKRTLLDSVTRADTLLHRRRLVTTNAGLVGLVPRASKRGDIVAVLFGCREPLVLRPCVSQMKSCYQVVGSCYVHTVMEGELMESVRLGQLAPSEICLC